MLWGASVARALAGRLVTWLVPVLLLSLVASGCTTGVNPVSGNRRAYGYSWEEELQLGKEADQQIVQQYGAYDNEQLQQYVERVGQEVLSESHLRRPDTPQQFRNAEFTFRVLDSPVVNAFALPGGFVYVTRGLLAHLNNEAQLAVVLGHEIGHVAARHASQQAAKQQFAQLGLIAGAIGGEIAGLPGGDILQLGSQATQLLFLKYSRDNERESDRLGVEYAAKLGYEASEGAAFFESLERIQEKSGQALPTWQSSHPDPGDREETILQLSEEWQAQLQQPLDEVDQAQYYDQIDGLVVGENPRQGFTADGMFYHPDLRFQFPVPPEFEVVNQAASVIMVAPDQRAILQFGAADAESPQAAAATLTQSQGIQVIDEGPVDNSRFPAYAVEAVAQTQQGEVQLLAHYVEYDDAVYGFLGYAGVNDFEAYRSTFLQTMRGFAELTDPDVLDVQPTRMAIQSVGETAPFGTFVPPELPEGFTAQELAILNQVGLDETIQAGQPLKLLQE